MRNTCRVSRSSHGGLWSLNNCCLGNNSLSSRWLWSRRDVLSSRGRERRLYAGGVADLETALATAGLVTRATGFAFAGAGVTLLGAATGAAAGAFGFL